MKNIANPIFTVSALLASMMSFAACDEVSENERLVYVEPAAVSRAVLIEDFTGQNCVNCPKATIAIHEIQELYGEDHVIPVAIHCGSFGYNGSSKVIGLQTPTGIEYWNKWFSDGQGQPVAKINRGPHNDSPAEWGKIVAQAIAETSDVALSCDVSYNTATREAEIVTRSLAPDGYKAHLQLWLVQDSIVTMQRDGEVRNNEYVHNHVFRAAINDTWGEEVSYGETELTKTRTYTLPVIFQANEKCTLDTCYAEHCSVIAFIYDDNGVQQVVKTPVVKK